jgi:hypothetical protein
VAHPAFPFYHGRPPPFHYPSPLCFHLAILFPPSPTLVSPLLILFSPALPCLPCFYSTNHYPTCRPLHQARRRHRFLSNLTFQTSYQNPSPHQSPLSFQNHCHHPRRHPKIISHLTPTSFRRLIRNSLDLQATLHFQSNQQRSRRLYHRPFPYHPFLNQMEVQRLGHLLLLFHRNLS